MRLAQGRITNGMMHALGAVALLRLHQSQRRAEMSNAALNILILMQSYWRLSGFSLKKDEGTGSTGGQKPEDVAFEQIRESITRHRRNIERTNLIGKKEESEGGPSE